MKKNRRHTGQAAQHMAAVAALTYAEQLAARGLSTTISTDSASVLRSMSTSRTDAMAGSAQPRRHNSCVHAACEKLASVKAAKIARDFTSRVRFTTVTAAPLGLLAEAEKAAFLKDLKAHVTTKHARRAVSLWDESRVWDPGD